MASGEHTRLGYKVYEAEDGDETEHKPDCGSDHRRRVASGFEEPATDERTDQTWEGEPLWGVNGGNRFGPDLRGAARVEWGGAVCGLGRGPVEKWGW